ncbi:MAG: prepilin peptidase [Alphaproteobacteria bacterium]|nr:prepilin peptidase [Alphaproteobacteria bacterium]MBV9692970.1 prepilin peptidase [Alphaproteobacteria bacterium]
MIAEMLLLVAVPALLALAAGWDVASFTIPNAIPLALLAAFAMFVFAVPLAPATAGLHLGAGAVGLAAGFALFAAGLIGGGDAKLFAAAALWLGFRDLVDFALWSSLFGGALALAVLGLRTLVLPATLATQGWLVRLHDAKSGIPYGVALAGGALMTLPNADVYRFLGA